MTDHQDRQLMLLMKKWLAGMAEETITYNVKYGIGAWRGFYHNRLPEIDHQKQLLMNGFNSLGGTTTITLMKTKVQITEESLRCGRGRQTTFLTNK